MKLVDDRVASSTILADFRRQLLAVRTSNASRGRKMFAHLFAEKERFAGTENEAFIATDLIRFAAGCDHPPFDNSLLSLLHDLDRIFGVVERFVAFSEIGILLLPKVGHRPSAENVGDYFIRRLRVR